MTRTNKVRQGNGACARNGMAFAGFLTQVASHGPVAYFIGGPSDVAFPNAEDDFTRITKVPVFKGNLNVGHGGTYRQPGGGWFGEVAVAWLDYQLKSNADAARWFVGADCGLCREPVWSVEKKGMR